MTRKNLFRALIAFLFALVLLPPGLGTAENAPCITDLTPGNSSRVVSPIQISAEIQPDAGGLVRLELLNKQGKAIARQLLRLDAGENGSSVPFTAELPFEIPTKEAEALLTLSLLDPFYRPVALRSARITLHAGGEAQIEPTQEAKPWITLTHPEPMDILTGGSLTVAGTATPRTENPLLIELIADDGRVIGSAQVRVQSPVQTFAFETKLFYYYIQSFTDARLVVRQSESAYNTTVVLDSTLIGVAP